MEYPHQGNAAGEDENICTKRVRRAYFFEKVRLH